MAQPDNLAYIRKLNAQELGYRRGVPRQAGRYIFVSKRCLDYFPPLTTLVRNDYLILYLIPPDSTNLVMCNYVYHNDKIVDSKPSGRDEFRIYLNNEIDSEGDFFQPDDLVILHRYFEPNTGEPEFYRTYYFPVAAGGANYRMIEEILDDGQVRGSHALVSVSNLPFIEMEEPPQGERVIPNEIMNNVFENPLMNEFEEREIAQVTRIARSTNFRDLVLHFYDYRCAIGGPIIRYSMRMNLEAAHIIPVGERGGDNPVNGMAMCRDFHWAFDCGFFTLDDDFHVQVHERVLGIPVLAQINGRRIYLPEDERARPHLDAIQYHREEKFGRFIRSG